MNTLNKINDYLVEADMDEIHKKIIEFFKKNPNPPDEKIHALADKLGIAPDKFEEHVYMILSSFLKKEKE